ncbi:putative siderophore transport system permease protein YfiZ [Paraconexibacter sp. AEG42_29]|uniref:Siderophore transport system permease protein YfiZ n=1 Tax=Paraconexibacter sp. AEG42_29 TaxID=2997339 RepID=A0AAU7AU10_9ACTN
MNEGLLGHPAAKAAGLAGALLLLAAAAVCSVLVGNGNVAVRDVVDAYSGFDGSNVQRAVRYVRVPRTLVAIEAGAALGVAGALAQGLTRNPLAGPDILGVTAGASLAAVLAIATLGITTLSGYVWFAFLGAALGGGLVYLLASTGPTGATPVKLALAGVGVSAMLGAITSAFTFLDLDTLRQYRFWVVGSLNGTSQGVVAPLLPFVLVGIALSAGLARGLNVLALGDELAVALGRRLAWTRGTGAAAVVLLAGSATAAAGPIGFVGLTVPHAARAITGPDHRWLLPYAAVLSATLLVVADTVGRVVARPQEIQVGIVTALVGAPVFILLVRRQRLSGL